MTVIRDKMVHRPLRLGKRTPDVETCLFTMSLEQVLVALAKATSIWCRANTPTDLRRRSEFAQIGSDLSEAARLGLEMVDVPTPAWDGWAWIAIYLRSDRQFETISCERCGRDCLAAEVTREPWVGDGCGGSSYRCPAGHLLYSLGEWIS